MRKLLESASLLLLTILIALALYALYGSHPIPARIPVHFNLAGQPDGYGSPNTLLLLPALALGVYLLLTLIARFPSTFSFPTSVTPASRPHFETIALLLLSALKAEILLLFTVLELELLHAARTTPPATPTFSLLPVFAGVALILATIFLVLRAMARPAL